SPTRPRLKSGRCCRGTSADALATPISSRQSWRRRRPAGLLQCPTETSETRMLDLGRTFLQSMERSPTTLAIVDEVKRLTYAEWGVEIAKLISGLKSMELGH